MQVTATVDLKKQTKASLSAMRKHNEHDPRVKHSNMQIYSEDTELNKRYNLLSLDDTLEQVYGGLIEERNKRTEEQFKSGKYSFNQYQERKTDLKKWLDNGGKSKTAFTTWVVTFGNAESNLEMMNKLGVKYELRKVKSEHGYVERPFVLGNDRQKWAKFWQTIYLRYARAFNANDFGFKITTVDVHLDEGGAPHAHFESVNCGKTAKGKASYNLNSAVKKSLVGFGSKVSNDTRVNLQMFRHVVDNELVMEVNEQAKKDYGVNLGVSMYRKKSKHKGLDMEEYKQRQASLAEIKKNEQVLANQRRSFLEEQQQQQQRLRQLREEREELEKQNNKQKEELARAQAELAQVEQSKQAKRAEVSNIQAELAKLEQTKQDKQVELSNAKNELSKIEQAKATVYDEFLELKKQIRTLKPRYLQIKRIVESQALQASKYVSDYLKRGEVQRLADDTNNKYKRIAAERKKDRAWLDDLGR